MFSKLSNIPEDTDVFVDSNIFVYHLTGDARYSHIIAEFFRKIELGNVNAYFNIIVFDEVLFNFLKAKTFRIWVKRKISFNDLFKKKPEIVGKIDCSPVMKLFSIDNLNFLSLEKGKLKVAFKRLKDRTLLIKYNLLPSDSLIALYMKQNNVKHIATNDSDFERVKGIKVWKPQ